MKQNILKIIVHIVFQFVNLVTAIPVTNVKDNEMFINILSRMILDQPCHVWITWITVENSIGLINVIDLKESSIPITIGKELHAKSYMQSCHLDIVTNKYINGLDLKKEENIYVYDH